MFINCLTLHKYRFLNQRQKVVNKFFHFYGNRSINEAKIQFFQVREFSHFYEPWTWHRSHIYYTEQFLYHKA